MRMNRRNVLVGLGTIVAGGGIALGSGAFSQVEASRTVDIGTAGDADALIGLSVQGDLAGDDGEQDDLIAFDLEEDLNIDATTTFTGAFTVTNNREVGAGSVSIDIEDADDPGTSLINDAGSTVTGMNFVTTDDPSDVSEDEGTVTFDVVFDLVGVTDTNTSDDEIPDEITIRATAN